MVATFHGGFSAGDQTRMFPSHKVHVTNNLDVLDEP
jgi:hypothetical protein